MLRESLAKTALQQAASGGHLEVVILLLDNGADVNAVEGYALQQAASSSCKAVLNLLLQHRADVNATGGEDGTALQRSELQRRMDIAELLKKRDEGGTTVHHTTSADDTPLAGLLLEKPEQGISVGQAEIQSFPVESEDDRVDARFKMDILDPYVLPNFKSAWKTIMPLRGKDLDADVRKRARVSILIEKPNKRRKTGKIDMLTLDPQLTSWYSGSGRAIKMKAAEEENEDEAEPEAKSSAASEEREYTVEGESQETPEAGSSKGKEREVDVDSDKGKWVP